MCWVGPGQVKLAQSRISVPVATLQRHPISAYQDYEFLAAAEKYGPYPRREATDELGGPPSNEPNGAVDYGASYLDHG